MTRVPHHLHGPETATESSSALRANGLPIHHDDAHEVGELVRRGRAWIADAMAAPDVAERTGVVVDADAIARLERRIEDMLRGAFPTAPEDLDLEPGWLAVESRQVRGPAADDPVSREARRTLRLHAHIRNLIERSWSEAVESVAGKVGDLLLERVDVGDAVLALAGLPRGELEAGLRRHERAVVRGHAANLTARVRQELIRRFTHQVARLARAYDPAPAPAVRAHTPPADELAWVRAFQPPSANVTAAWAQGD